MVNVSNNLIATLLVAAIVISGFGLVTIANIGRISVTGGATGTGAANVTISGQVAIELLKNFTHFNTSTLGGAGRAISTQGDNYGTFEDGGEGNGTSGGDVYGTCVGTEATCAFPFVVRNTGNVNASINVSSTNEASTWIGTGAAAQVKGKNNETNACGADFSGLAGFGEAATWSNLNSTATGETVVCTDLDFRDAVADELRIHFQLTLPSDAVGGKQDVVTVGAIDAS